LFAEGLLDKSFTNISPFSNGTIFETDVSQITESSDEMGLMLSFPKYDSQSATVSAKYCHGWYVCP
jgi:hypothetical protein